MIQLNNKWHIEPDTTSGWRLVFQEPRTRLDKKTNEEVEYIFENVWYFPTLKMILEKYLEEASKECNTIEELITKLSEISKSIDDVKKIYVVEGKLKEIK